MVAGSRSSLRRPSLRGQKSPGLSSPAVDSTPPLRPQSGNGANTLRSKRVRSSTISGQEQDLKRRRLSTNKGDIAELRIPLRSRGGLPKVISPPPAVTPSAPTPKLYANTPTSIPRPLDSPSGKPQYDQIKIIEEKAKASIRGNPLSVAQDERRKLRSEDGGSRAKTELAQYFPDFEEMLSLKPPDPGETTSRENIITIQLTRHRNLDCTDQDRPCRRYSRFPASPPQARSFWCP